MMKLFDDYFYWSWNLALFSLVFLDSHIENEIWVGR